MESRVSSNASGLQLEHKHGLDEWSPMLPERSAQVVVPGDEPSEELYRCQRVGCTEVVRARRDDTTRSS
jgi:hypothetical protein